MGMPNRDCVGTLIEDCRKWAADRHLNADVESVLLAAADTMQMYLDETQARVERVRCEGLSIAQMNRIVAAARKR